MAEAAVFEGSLVNLKNSPTHKSVVLQVEVPEEYGEAIVRAFGWPTRVKPLPVAVARLEAPSEVPAPKRESSASPRPFYSLTLAEQAGIVCKDPEFWKFLDTDDEEATARRVRLMCRVNSRAEFLSDKVAGERWKALLANYGAWKDARARAFDQDPF